MAKPETVKNERAARARLNAYQARQNAFDRARKRRKRDNAVWGLCAAAVVLIAVGSQVGFTLTRSAPAASATPQANQLPQPTYAQSKEWTTTLGINNTVLTIALDGKRAPQAVSSTLVLAQNGFYKNTKCHRLTTEGIFVLQCGDPKGDGTGGPGYLYGPVENAPQGDLYPAGTIAMARQGGNAASMGSQFFIVYRDSVIPSDNAGGYTVIGNIKSGLAELMKSVIDAGTENNVGDGPPKQSAIINYFDILPQ